MGKVNSYNNLSLDEKLSYWEDYLQGLVDFSLSRTNIPMREDLTKEILRIRNMIHVFSNDIQETYIESNMGVKPPTEASVKRILKNPKKLKVPVKDRENYTKLYRYRYESESGSFMRIQDEDRSKET